MFCGRSGLRVAWPRQPPSLPSCSRQAAPAASREEPYPSASARSRWRSTRSRTRVADHSPRLYTSSPGSRSSTASSAWSRYLSCWLWSAPALRRRKAARPGCRVRSAATRALESGSASCSAHCRSRSASSACASSIEALERPPPPRMNRQPLHHLLPWSPRKRTLQRRRLQPRLLNPLLRAPGLAKRLCRTIQPRRPAPIPLESRGPSASQSRQPTVPLPQSRLSFRLTRSKLSFRLMRSKLSCLHIRRPRSLPTRLRRAERQLPLPSRGCNQ